MADGQVVFEITGDGRKAKASIEDIIRAMEQAGKKWDRAAGDSTQSIENKFVKMFKTIAASAVAAKVGQVLLDWGKQAIQAASDLEEVQNVVDVTFGDGAAKINSWAKAAGQQFGLTETQAKRFTSTLGAMMKSAGMAGPEIVEMSTDLAGLAADMASFYNLDFDTAFQKIRSGISGETEPLKQLGINMSVANLEAYALTQGITKAFNSMSQGEQTMLRYQYLMQATSDAQGDFARTSDGFANSIRQFQTNLDTLKTNVGQVLLPVVNGVVAGINDMLTALTATPERTILDDFADIDLQTEQKIREIDATAEKARELIGALDEIEKTGFDSTLVPNLTSFVNALSASFGDLGTALDKAKNGDYKGTISEIAKAMELKTSVSADKWETLLNAIAQHLPGATSATLSDDEQTAAWLRAAGEAAASLGGDYSQLWGDLLTTLGDDAGTAIAALAGGAEAAEAMGLLADKGNSLNANTPKRWEDLLKALDASGNFTGLTNAGGAIQDLSNALNGTDPNTDRAQAWQTLLDALGSDMEALSGLTGESAEDTAAWLERMAEAANELDPNRAEGWDKLYNDLLAGLPGLKDTELGADLFGLGAATNDYDAFLRALGIETDDIVDKQAAWLKICNELVKTIPGLSSIINTQTGEVEGGVTALADYVTEWQNLQRAQVMYAAVQAKIRALQEDPELYNRMIEMYTQRGKVSKLQSDLDAVEKRLKGLGIDPTTLAQTNPTLYNLAMQTAQGLRGGAAANNPFIGEDQQALAEWINLIQDLGVAQEELDRRTARYTETLEGNELAQTDLMTAAEAVAAEMGIDIETLKEMVASTTEEGAAAAATAADINTLTDALKALNDYQGQVRDQTAQAVDGLIGGFKSIKTPADEAREKMSDLTKQIDELNAAGKDSSGLSKTFADAENSLPSIQNMTQALEDQLKYIEDYQKYLDIARQKGVSEDILGMLSDGSAESFDYLRAIATTGGSVDELNAKYQELQEKKQGFVDTLTENKLAVDDTYQGMVTAAQNAAAQLDVSEAAQAGVEATVAAIATGIQNETPEVTAAIDALEVELQRLQEIWGSLNLLLNLPTPGTPGPSSPKTPFDVHPHATGLDYVPYDNYLASLHEGETILTAEEARVWRNFKDGGVRSENNINYGEMSAAIWGSAPSMDRGVFLDGKLVGQYVSAQQGNAYRQLQRSGWTR